MFEEYWRFSYLRQEVFFNKQNNILPYTTNEILKNFKFCNAYRVLDRISQYLVKHIVKNTSGFQSEDVVFRVVFFKLFNLSSTWEYLEEHIGPIRLSNFDIKTISALLMKRKQETAIYNSAYISCATKAFGFDSKHDNHLALLHKMFIEDQLASKLIACTHMKQCFDLLKSYPLIGSFMAYQLATDIGYCDFILYQETDFTIAGPGAVRGIKKAFERFSSFEEAIWFAYEKQEEYFEKLGLPFKYIHNRKLQPIDIQNLFCEFDKYCREAHPHLKSNRTKIKAKYSPNSQRIEYVFPNKWNASL